VPVRPLLLTGDPVLLDDLLRLAAAAGVETEVAPDAGAARASWVAAPLVLVGADLIQEVLRAGLPRRPGVVVVPTDLGDAQLWQLAAAAGAESVQPLPGAEALLVDRLAAAADGPARSTTVAVVGGRGGAGASTLACALARTARASATVMLVDGDPRGGGLDLLMGAEGMSGLRWPDLAAASGRASPDELRAALPCVDGVTLLSWHRGNPVELPAAAMDLVLGAGCRGHDLVVVDLPRHWDAAARAAVAAADTVLLIVPAEVRAVAAASQVVTRLVGRVADVRVVVRGPSPARLSDRVVARELGLPLAGWLAPEPGLAAAQERGEPPGRSGRGPLVRLCTELLAGLGDPAGRVA